jgi:DNA-binding NtrC family response regulator
MAERLPLVYAADDRTDVLESLRLLLKAEGYALQSFGSAPEIAAAMRTGSPDAVLLDLNYGRDTTSGEEGLDWIMQIRSFDSATPLIAMTAWGSVEIAVEAMRRGAQDFIEKPWENERLLSVLRTQIALGRAARRTSLLEAHYRQLVAVDTELIAKSASMQPILETIDRVAPSDANVLITGESGTGKGLLARVIHERSARRERDLVIVNIGSLPETLFESELFGHVKGAFTDAKADRIGRFEFAEGGTLFLDEIANIPLPQQARLLRVLEEGQFERLGSSRTQQVNVRVLAATNADLTAEIEAGRFRNDLLYRINTIYIHLPPLRERIADIEPLANLFLARHARRHRRAARTLGEDALSAARRYRWPGNVRELSHVVERAVLMATGSCLSVSDLGLSVGAEVSPARAPVRLERLVEEAIRAAIGRHQGNTEEAAAELGISRSALYRRMEKFDL